jgi:aspartate kinase
VTIKDHIMVINIHSNRKSVSHGFLASIFSLLDKHKLVVDLISTSEVHISMALNEGMREHILRELVEDLKRHGAVDVVKGMAILSLVGKQMKHLVGIAGRMFSTLASVDVNLEMISQGASEIKFAPESDVTDCSISCVIEGSDAVKALNAIHYHLLSAPVSALEDKPHLFM